MRVKAENNNTAKRQNNSRMKQKHHRETCKPTQYKYTKQQQLQKNAHVK